MVAKIGSIASDAYATTSSTTSLSTINRPSPTLTTSATNIMGKHEERNEGNLDLHLHSSRERAASAHAHDTVPMSDDHDRDHIANAACGRGSGVGSAGTGSGSGSGTSRSGSGGAAEVQSDPSPAPAPALPASSYFKGSPDVNTSGGRKLESSCRSRSRKKLKLSSRATTPRRTGNNSRDCVRASNFSTNSPRPRVAFLMANSQACHRHSLANAQASACVSSPAPASPLMSTPPSSTHSANASDVSRESSHSTKSSEKDVIRGVAAHSAAAHPSSTARLGADCVARAQASTVHHEPAKRQSSMLPHPDRDLPPAVVADHGHSSTKSLISRAQARLETRRSTSPSPSRFLQTSSSNATSSSSSSCSPRSPPLRARHRQRPQPSVSPAKELPLRVVVSDQLFLRCYRKVSLSSASASSSSSPSSGPCRRDPNVDVWARHYDEHQRHLDPSFCWPNMASRHVVFRRAARRIFAPSSSPSPRTASSPRFPLATSPTLPRYSSPNTRTPEQHTAQAHLARDLSNIREEQRQQAAAASAASASKENLAGKTNKSAAAASSPVSSPVATVFASPGRKGSSPNLSQLDTPPLPSRSPGRSPSSLVNQNPSISSHTGFPEGARSGSGRPFGGSVGANATTSAATSPLFDAQLQMAIVRSVFQLCALPAHGVGFERFVSFVSEIGILGTSDSIHERTDVRAVFAAASGFSRKDQDPPRHVLLTQETFFDACLDLAVRKYSNNAYEALAQRYASNQHSMAFCLNCFIVEHLTVFVQNVHRRSRGFANGRSHSHPMKAAAAAAPAAAGAAAANGVYRGAGGNDRDYHHSPPSAAAARTHHGGGHTAAPYYAQPQQQQHHHQQQRHYGGNGQQHFHQQVSSPHYSRDYRSAPAYSRNSGDARNNANNAGGGVNRFSQSVACPIVAISDAAAAAQQRRRHHGHHAHHQQPYHHHAAAAAAAAAHHHHHRRSQSPYGPRHHHHNYGHTYGASHATHDALSVPNQIPIRS